MDAWLVVGAGFTALVLAVGHWAPWPSPLSWLQRYVYGVASVIGGFAIWRLCNGDWLTPLALFCIAAVGGCTVILTYRIDAVVLAIRKASKAESVDDELS